MFNFKSEFLEEARLNLFREAGCPKDSLFHDFLTCRNPLACFILFIWRRTLRRGRFLEQMPSFSSGFALRITVLFWALAFANASRAQDAPVPSSQAETQTADAPADPEPQSTMFPHPESDRIWISGQANFISQWHPAFHSPYMGPNSLPPQAQDATSRVLTLFTGLRLSGTTEFLCDVQETGGHGIGEALGLAGVTNLDIVRNTNLSKAPYVARLMWHQILPLGHQKIENSRSPFSLFSSLPERRLEMRFGKFSLVDFFDVNSYGSDTTFQFMNWTVDNNGAYDYAAGYAGLHFRCHGGISRSPMGRAVCGRADAKGGEWHSPRCRRGPCTRRKS
jgi:hypothetical protein